jgi:prohibitin 1
MTPSDQQQVRIKLRLLSRPRESALPVIFAKYGGDHSYKQLALTGVMKQVLPTVVAHYNAEELITERDRVSQEVRTQLTQRCLEFGIEVEDVAIVECVFSRDWQNSVEQKQVAQQMAEREKFVVLASEQQRKIAEIKAEADSISADLLAAAMAKNGDGLVQLRQLEAAREIARVMSQSPNVTYLPGSNGKDGKGNMMLNVGA